MRASEEILGNQGPEKDWEARSQEIESLGCQGPEDCVKGQGLSHDSRKKQGLPELRNRETRSREELR